MKFKIVNYKRFIFMTVLSCLVLFLLIWGIFALFQNLFFRNNQTVEEEVIEERITPLDPSSPYLAYVSESNPLPQSYAPSDLTEAQISSADPIELSQETASHIQELFTAAQTEGINLYAISGYRSYDDQEVLYEEATSETDIESTTSEDNPPGTNEHQLGFAVDVTTEAVNDELVQDFAVTEAGQWVAAHAPDYGFIIRYPQGEEAITGHMYEPWHLRYVGIQDAKRITENHLTLEEYLGLTEEADETSTSTTEN